MREEWAQVALVYKFKIDGLVGGGGSEGILALTKCVSVFVHLRYEVRVKVPCGIWSFCIMKAGM